MSEEDTYKNLEQGVEGLPALLATCHPALQDRERPVGFSQQMSPLSEEDTYKNLEQGVEGEAVGFSQQMSPLSEEDTYKNLEQMSPLPSETGFTKTMKIGAIMCIEQDGELWDPFIVVSINHSNSSIKVIMPHMKYDGVCVLFGEDRSTQTGDFTTYEFIEKHDIEYVAIDIFIESDEGEYYVEDTNYRIVFLQDLDGVIQRPLSILT